MRSKKTSGIAKSKTEVIIIRIKKAALGTRVSHDWQDRWSPGGRRLQMGVPRGVCFQARRGLRHRFQQKGALNASHQFITFHEYNKKNDKKKWKKEGVTSLCSKGFLRRGLPRPHWRQTRPQSVVCCANELFHKRRLPASFFRVGIQIYFSVPLSVRNLG